MRLYLTSQGKPFEIIQDIGSGINYQKKGSAIGYKEKEQIKQEN